MYPTTATAASAATAAAAKFQNRSASPPQFASFAPPSDYPGQAAGAQTVAAAAVHNAPGSMSMRHAKAGSALTGRERAGPGIALPHMGMGGHGAATLGHHRGDLIFPDDMDSIEFCMPPPPQNGGHSHGLAGLNGELMQLHSSGHGEAFTERRRRGHSRRSNHKMDVEQHVKWSRKNIAATMERFEPTNQSSSSTSSLDYGFAAGVMTPSSTTAAAHHNGSGGSSSSVGIAAATGMSSTPSLHVAYNGGAAAPVAPFNHVYSYAYYEPGAAKCHTNVPHKEAGAAACLPGPSNGSASSSSGLSKSPPRNSIRALLAKSFRSKSSHSGQSTSSSPSTEDRDRHTYTTRYGTTENLYEEVNEQKMRKVLSDNRIATSSVGNVKEEQRRVQHNHFRVLDELNLSLEALIMPPTPPDISPSNGGPADDDDEGPSTSAAAAAQAKPSVCATGQRPRRGGLLGGAASAASATAVQQRALSHASLENLSTTLNSMELKDHAHSSCINPEFDEGDLDSGFSGSGSSSGASYNESLRYYKTGTPTNHSHHHSHQHHHQQQQQQQQQQAPLNLNLNLSLNQNNHHSGSSSHHHNNMNMNINNNNNNINHMHTLPHNLRSCRSSTASGTSTSKSSMASCGEDQGIAGMGMGMGMSMGMGMGMNMGMMMGGNGAGLAASNNCGATDVNPASLSPFNYPRRCSADTQRASSRSIAASSTASTSTGAKPKKNFWTIKP